MLVGHFGVQYFVKLPHLPAGDHSGDARVDRSAGIYSRRRAAWDEGDAQPLFRGRASTSRPKRYGVLFANVAPEAAAEKTESNCRKERETIRRGN